MGQMMIATLCEGIEAFLIVAIAAAYMKQAGRAVLLPAVWWGVATAALASIVLGTLLAGCAPTSPRASRQPRRVRAAAPGSACSPSRSC